MPRNLDYWIRYVHTVRHLKPIQVWSRVLLAAKQRIGGMSLPELPDSLDPIPAPSSIPSGHDPWNTREDVLNGTFTFLNQTQNLGVTVDWDAPDMPLLWRFNLHYFQYIHLLNLDEQVKMCLAWINAHPPGASIAWHPYPTSLRLVNWAKTRIRTRAILESAYLQAGHLYRNIEYHILGNHLIENARALVVMGQFFRQKNEAKLWFEKGIDLIVSEIKEQVLSDGGHFERSPMYHALMLECFLDVIEVVPATHKAHAVLMPAITQMADFLASLTHPDGHLVLFNDATQEVAPMPNHILERVQTLTGHHAEKKAVFQASGYYLYNGNDTYLALDAGPVGPDYLTAHAHADVFSYELSVLGTQFIVDSGVYEYQKGPMRDYVRSTRAHNTVCIDEQDQVECWDSFRVGRRWKPDNIVFASQSSQCRFDGIYGGYAHLIGDQIMHRRKVTINENVRQVQIDDLIDGQGTHCVESLIHLHPEVQIKQHEDYILLTRGNVSCKLFTQPSTAKIESGWYCPQFGTRLSNSVVVLGGETRLPVHLSYSLQY